MSLYIGTSDHTADLVASTTNKSIILKIIEKYFSPKIGDIKYLAIPKFYQIDINDNNFDGWVYADGSSLDIRLTDFLAAKLFFDIPLDATSLEIPNLCKFIQANPDNTFKYEYNDSNMQCTDHKHDIDTEINYKSNNNESFILSSAFKVAITNTELHVIVHPTNKSTVLMTANKWQEKLTTYAGYVPGLHGAANIISNNDHRVNIDLHIPAGVDFSALPTKITGEDHPDVYPAHVLLAVMLYIGRKDS